MVLPGGPHHRSAVTAESAGLNATEAAHPGAAGGDGSVPPFSTASPLTASADRLARAARPPRLPDGLSAREVEVLRLIALGHTSVEVARTLHLSPRTIETHRARINRKLGLRKRAELVRYALRRGLLVV